MWLLVVVVPAFVCSNIIHMWPVFQDKKAKDGKNGRDGKDGRGDRKEKAGVPCRWWRIVLSNQDGAAFQYEMTVIHEQLLRDRVLLSFL